MGKSSLFNSSLRYGATAAARVAKTGNILGDVQEEED